MRPRPAVGLRAAPRFASRATGVAPALVALALLVGGVAGPPARAQEAGAGAVRGRVFDAETGEPVAGATVVIVGSAPEGGEPSREVGVTDAEGAFAFPAIPAGTYTVHFTKSGYRASSMTEFAVVAGQVNRADFPLPPAPPETAEQILELEAFVVEASTVEEIMDAIELRTESDELLNIMSAEDLSKFAASDVADALKRVAGVNVVEGQFAIIRGLEDRYNNTLYNSAPVPSPDPDSQSVQLDLFPSDVVTNLIVSKTFAADLPSNTSGGLINIITLDYPEKFELKASTGSGWSSNAWDRFLRYQEGSPVGIETDGWDTVEREFGGSIGGRRELFGREFRFKAVGNREIDFVTGEGYQEQREPRPSEFRPRPPPGFFVRSGDLSLGELDLSAGRFDLTESGRSEQDTGYGAFGLDLDEEGQHRIDLSALWTKKKEEVVQLEENGYFRDLDYSVLARKQLAGFEIDRNQDFNEVATLTTWIARTVRGSANDPPSRGPLWSSTFFESSSFKTDRDLLVTQLNGDHRFEPLDGLHASWALNRAKTSQREVSLGARYFFEPEDPSQFPPDFPSTVDALEPGSFFANNGLFSNSNEIDEKQRFARLDLDYERMLAEPVSVVVQGGLWTELARRDVASSFLENASLGGSTQFALEGETQQELGESIFEELDRNEDGLLAGLRETSNESKRKIRGWNVEGKATFWDRVDLLGGVRRESIFIESLNDPFTGEDAFDSSPAIFPTKYLFFDRLDNPARNEVLVPPPPDTTFNDELLGIVVPIDPETGLVDLTNRAEIDALVNGLIDEKRFLPSAGFTVRPLAGLTLRGAWSKTVARPSFREMGYYVSVEPATDDLIVGNPQLGLSNVESFDARLEYVWGERSDLFGLSIFHKNIDDPIESIVIRNPVNLEPSASALFRTFFNNPNRGTLRGIEVEGRKSLDFLGVDWLRYLSLGGNFTYIKAKVDRTDIELARSEGFFGVVEGDRGRFPELEKTRRLFGQPKWIANADITFDHPDWGTKFTLAFFAISDVLDAAGAASIGPDGTVSSFTLDRYVDSFHQLDLVVSQRWHVDFLRGDLTLKASVKNLTDSTRSIVYDQEQTHREITERSLKIGRDYSFSITYTF